ncbi:helix-turn-helix transcriptional regulator [Rhizobium sp. SYY.PMSO]|uniref:helix-turn-helix transcriptional regulator n=1 Tax=Rhizobium sp. SYY.PMSO TaxID=3382192 RepID=UPI00398FEEBD
MTETSTNFDLIYEAAVNSDLWPQALEFAGRRLASISGELIVFTDLDEAPRFKATDFSRDALRRWIDSGFWQDSVMQRVARAGRPAFQTGVICTTDMLSEDAWQADPTAQVFESVGLHDQLFAPIFMPTDEVAFISFERRRIDGRFAPEAANEFANLLPHFSRSALITARLRLERAQAAAQALELLNLPAAVLSSSGKVLAANNLFSDGDQIFIAGAMDRVHLKVSASDTLFQRAVAHVGNVSSVVRSIGMRATEETMPAVIHVLPLRRSAHEILARGDVLVIATKVGSQPQAANSSLLIALFDLTPAEARIASLLSRGKTIEAAALESGLARKTVRSYLEDIFAKTGCHRQSDLRQLLRDVASVAT